MAMLNISTLLFSGDPETIQLTDHRYAVRSLGAEGLGLSPLRDTLMSKPRDKKAKMSKIGKILDMLFYYNNLHCYISSDGFVLMSFEYNGNQYCCQTSGDVENGITISWDADKVEKKLCLLPIFVHATTLENEASKMLREQLSELRKAINKNDKEKTDELILLICDTFYYGFSSNKKFSDSLYIIYQALESSLIKDSVAAGAVKPIEYLEPVSISSSTSTAYNTENKMEQEKETINKENFRVNYTDWNEDQLLKIPQSEDYVMTPTAEKIIRKIKFRTDRITKRMEEGKTGLDAIQNDYINIQLVGRPASGKTKLAYAVGEYVGMPVYTVPFTKNTEEDTVEGRNKVVQGKIDFVETDFLKAYQNGGIIVLEEINLADPAVVMGSLGQAIEFPFIVMKDGYTPVRRHPLCIIIATMNTGTAGSKSLNEAFSTRLKQTYVMEDPSRNLFLEILQSKGFPKKNCNWVYNAYTRIINSLKNGNEDLTENISLRSCIGALENIEEGSSPKEAIKDTIIGKIAEKDLETARKTEMEVVESLPERM